MALLMSSRRDFTSSNQLNLLSSSLPKWQRPHDSQGQARAATPSHGVNQKRHCKISEVTRKTTRLSSCPHSCSHVCGIVIKKAWQIKFPKLKPPYPYFPPHEFFCSSRQKKEKEKQKQKCNLGAFKTSI